MRVLDAAGEQPAGLHHLVAGVVDGRGRVVDRADQRELVGVPGHLREDLADLHARARWSRSAGTARGPRRGRSAWGPRCRCWLGPPTQEQHDAVDVAVLSRAGGLRGAGSRAASGRAAARAPAWRKSRRVRPSQKVAGAVASRRIMKNISGEVDGICAVGTPNFSQST